MVPPVVSDALRWVARRSLRLLAGLAAFAAALTCTSVPAAASAPPPPPAQVQAAPAAPVAHVQTAPAAQAALVQAQVGAGGLASDAAADQLDAGAIAGRQFATEAPSRVTVRASSAVAAARHRSGAPVAPRAPPAA